MITILSMVLVTTPVALAVCGDLALDIGEACDDGNNSTGDGCNATCGVESGWQCPGNDPITGRSLCEASLCGDGVHAVGSGAIVVEQRTKILGPSESGSRAGTAVVAVNEDLVAIGSRDKDTPGVNGGEVRLYERNMGGLQSWGLIKTLTPSGHAAGDYFGRSIDADAPVLYQFVVVGAPRRSSSAGAVFVFEEDQGGSGMWGEQAAIVTSDSASGDECGTAVSIAGSPVVGGAWVAVGCPLDDDPAPVTGDTGSV